MSAASVEHANRRLQHLFEVSKLLTSFDGVDRTVPAVISVLAQALPLRSAIFILGTEGRPHTLFWQADAESANELRAADAHARKTYAYLVGPAAAGAIPDDWARTTARSAEQTDAPSHHHNFVILPLAVARRPIFGALQLEGVRRLDEMELVFVNTVLNQLAIALDRQAVVEARQAASERRRVEAEESQIAAERGRGTAEALRERYEALVDNTHHAFVWEADARTLQVSYISARAAAVLGHPRARWLGNSNLWTDCVHPEDRDALAQTFRRVLREKRDERRDHRCVTADGRVIWLHTGIHLAHADTAAPQLQGVSVDVTPTKDAEANVRGQLEFTRAVTASLGEGVLAVDLSSRITFFNAATAQMLGLKEEEVDGQFAGDVLQIHHMDGAPIDSEESPFQRVMRTGRSLHSEEYRFSTSNRSAFPVAFTCSVIRRGEQVCGAVLAFQDIGERKRAERELYDAVKRAYAASRAREELLAIVSHDLQNPLSVILMSIAVMAGDSSGVERRKSAQQIALIKRAVDDMHRLLQDLLDAASVDAGRLSIVPGSLHLDPFMNETIEGMQPLARSKSVRLKCVLPESLPHVFADRVRLKQVLGNLVSNALVFTPPGGTITVRALEVDGFMQFSVTDTGCGISNENIPHLFERFWQVQRKARQGTGLGLSIVKGIVTAHGGRVWVESRLGMGSTFFFTLPLVTRDGRELELV